MSLTTRCPACTTRFKVVRDQLRISDGWVRCGRCGDVFDATSTLDDAGLSEAIDTNRARSLVDEATSGVDSPALTANSDPVLSTHAASDVVDDQTAVQADPTPGTSTQHPTTARPFPGRDRGKSQSPAWWREQPSLDLPSPTGAIGVVASRVAFMGVASAHADGSGEAGGTMNGKVDEIDSVATELGPVGANRPGSVSIDPGADGALTVARQAAAGSAVGFGMEAASISTPLDDASEAALQRALRAERVKAARGRRAARDHDAGANPAFGLSTAPGLSTWPVADDSNGDERVEAPVGDVARPGSEPKAPDARQGGAGSEVAAAGFLQHAVTKTTTAPAPARRAAIWGAVIGLCVALLGMQWLYHDRGAIAARVPALRPILAALCDWAGCELSALRQIDAVSISGASFSRAPSGPGYRLDFSLRNAEKVPIATPAVELSLLDTQERVVVRRVLQPGDFQAPDALIALGEQSASLPIQLGEEASALPPVAGFKLVAFYP